MEVLFWVPVCVCGGRGGGAFVLLVILHHSGSSIIQESVNVTFFLISVILIFLLQCGFKLFTRQAALLTFSALHVERW